MGKIKKISNGVIILSIETSCDDTCLAVIKASGKKNPRFNILSNIVSFQVEIHQKYGGVYPSLAKREHQKNLPIILEKTLRSLAHRFQRGAKLPDLIAVTVGPGLEPCLWVGINFAKNLAHKLNVPIMPVNHIEAHILANFIGENSKFQIPNSKNIFPAICLVVSGGHTQLILMKDFGKYKILGETRDDAAGECFDKVARTLGLRYPGGPAIAAEAAKLKIHPAVSGTKFKIKLPRPMLNQKNYDFSFSGLKTAVLYSFKSSFKKEMCKEIQQAVIDVLIKKTIKAAKDYKAKTVILGGGVSANNELRKQFQSTINNQQLTIKFLVPPKKFCTDNAVMVGIAGYYGWLKKGVKLPENIEANGNLKIVLQ